MLLPCMLERECFRTVTFCACSDAGSTSQLDALADFVGQTTGQQVPVKVLQHL